MVKDKLTDTEGFQLYDPIGSINIREENQNMAATRQNYKGDFDWQPFIPKLEKPKFTRSTSLRIYNRNITMCMKISYQPNLLPTYKF